LGISAIFGFVLFKYNQRLQQITNSIPYIVPGDSIKEMELTGMDTSKITAADLSKEQPALIFIFSRPCSPCNKNIPYWNKIGKILEGRAAIYGIVLSDLTEAYNFSEKAKLTFPLYIPNNLNQFIKEMKIKFNLPQTILYHKDKVYLTQLGLLNGDDTADIINAVKKLIGANQ
jgi:thiol-disulfide isomerase/thioredoxin